MMRTQNKKVAVEPFPEIETKVEARGGLPHIKQKFDLYAQRVVYGTDDGVYEPGDVVYVHGDACKHGFAKQVYAIEEGDDKRFIFVPYDMILGVDRSANVGQVTEEKYTPPPPTRVPGEGVQS